MIEATPPVMIGAMIVEVTTVATLVVILVHMDEILGAMIE